MSTFCWKISKEYSPVLTSKISSRFLKHFQECCKFSCDWWSRTFFVMHHDDTLLEVLLMLELDAARIDRRWTSWEMLIHVLIGRQLIELGILCVKIVSAFNWNELEYLCQVEVLVVTKWQHSSVRWAVLMRWEKWIPSTSNFCYFL